MLDANLQSQLKTYLERVTRPIQITAHADDGAKSQEMLELLQTLDSLSDKISLQVLRDGQGRVPSFDLGTPGQDIHLTFAGLPMGHEFTSLVLAQVRNLLLAVVPELPGRGAGPEPGRGAQPAHPACGHRRCAVPG